MVRLENLVISIGAQIEAEALKTLGLNEPKELEAKWLEAFEAKKESLNSINTWRIKSFIKVVECDLRYNELVKEYPGSYQSRNQLKKLAKFATGSLVLIKKDLQKEQRRIAEKDLEMQAILLTLRDAYLDTLKKIRGFGEEELHFLDYDEIIDESAGEDPNLKEVKNKLEAKHNRASHTKDNLDSVRVSTRLLPNDWIHSLNNDKLYLFVKTGLSKEQEKDVLGTFGTDSIAPNKIAFTKLPTTSKLIMRNWWLRVRVLTLRAKATEATILHELGHGIVDTYPIIGALEEAYYIRRTTKPDGGRSKVKKIDGNFIRKGGFVNQHIGKDSRKHVKRTLNIYKKHNAGLSKEDLYNDYGVSEEQILETKSKSNRRSSYEVFSTGLESILCGNNGYLAGILTTKQDTELRHLILGILAVV